MDTLYRHFERTGVEPHALRNQPMLEGHLMWVLELFTTLSAFRSWHEGIPNPIALSDILVYLDEVDVTLTTERQGLTDLISTCDSAFINHFADKQQKKMKQIKGKQR